MEHKYETGTGESMVNVDYNERHPCSSTNAPKAMASGSTKTN